jgi:CRP/FNR family transcriptional regulator
MTQEFEKPFCTHCQERLNSVFSELDEKTLEEMSEAKGCHYYKKGQVVFEAGAQPRGLFCLHRGKAKVYKTGDEGRDKIVRLVKGGDVLGYRSLVSGEPYNCSAAALEESVVCFIPQQTFFEMLRNHGGFSMRIIQLLSCELRQAEEQILNLAQKPVRERLAEAILILKEVYGTENGDSSTLNVTLSRDELASMVGTATETLVRTLSDLKRESLIATDKKKIRILDVPGLVRAGNLED